MALSSVSAALVTLPHWFFCRMATTDDFIFWVQGGGIQSGSSENANKDKTLDNSEEDVAAIELEGRTIGGSDTGPQTVRRPCRSSSAVIVASFPSETCPLFLNRVTLQTTPHDNLLPLQRLWASEPQLDPR